MHFRQGLEDKGGEPLTIDAVQELIQLFIHQYSEEHDALKKARRPGRPASTREDLLKNKIAALETEHEQGFYLPDIMSAAGVEILNSWEGSWTKLTTIPWIKVSTSDHSRPADFPTKGLN
jgi:translation machinery-associated protein 16